MQKREISKNLKDSKTCFEFARRDCLKYNDLTKRYSYYVICKEEWWNNQYIPKPPEAVDRIISTECKR